MVTNIGFHNHSNCSFTVTEQQVLGYGSKFRPSNPLPSNDRLAIDLDNFERRIRWTEFFNFRPVPVAESSEKYIPGFHISSKRSPPTASRATEVGLLDFRHEMVTNVNNARHQRRKLNLTAGERRAMEKLNQRDDIIICNADKNLGTVVLNTADYIAEGLRQLSDTKYYRLVATIPEHCEEPVHRFVAEVSLLESELQDIIECHTDLISKKDIVSFFTCFPFKPAKFYLLPKLHKPVGPHGPKGRPIVSCIGYCTSPASRFVDFHLKLLLENIDSETILKDTTMLTNTLKASNFPDSALLVTADVESLYTNMNWDDTVAAVNTLLVEAQHPLRPLLIDLLQFVLENNYFCFNETLYHQEYGMAMGTPMAVNVANAFLFVHERRLVSCFKSSIYLFNRFIDDLLLVIDMSCDLAAIKDSIYSDLSSVKLKWTTPAPSCIFLDLDIYKACRSNENVCVFEYRTFQKPLNAYLYIPFISDHPRSNLRAFIKAELLRYNRTNTQIADIFSIRRSFWLRLRRRGYPPHFLATIYNDVLPEVLHNAITSRESPKVNDSIAFCTTYHPHFHKVNYRMLMKQAFFTDGKIYFRKSKQLFY